MAAYVTTALASAIAAAMILAGPVQAQENGELSEDEVRSFFQDMEQELVGMVEAEDFEGLINWTEEAVADEAHFFAAMEVNRDGERKAYSVFRLDKEDMTQFGRLAIGAMAAMQGQGQGEGQPIEDYALDIEVSEVTPAGPDAATVTTRITETATLAMPTGQAGADAPAETEEGAEGSQGAATISVESTADCQHLIRRGEAGDRLLIGLTACEGAANF